MSRKDKLEDKISHAVSTIADEIASQIRKQYGDGMGAMFNPMTPDPRDADDVANYAICRALLDPNYRNRFIGYLIELEKIKE